MISYKRIKLEHLSKKEKQIYSKMLFPGIEHPSINPHFLDPNESQMVFAAHLQKKPIALLIGKPVTADVWEVASLFVDPTYRRRKIATHLLAQFEKELIKKKVTSVLLNYPHKLLNELDPFLTHVGWEGRKVFALECYFQNVQEFHPPWFEREYRQKSGDYSFFPWNELSDKEKETLVGKVKTGRFPIYYDPFQRESFEPNSSFGLRYKGELVGWSLTHEVKPNLLDFYCLYSEIEQQTKGAPILLLIHSIKGSQKHPFSARFFVNFKQVPLRWIRTVARRLAPYATQVTLYHQAWKSLVKKSE